MATARSLTFLEDAVALPVAWGGANRAAASSPGPLAGTIESPPLTERISPRLVPSQPGHRRIDTVFRAQPRQTPGA